MGRLVIANNEKEAYQDKYIGYGTNTFYITREQIQALFEGKYLVDSDPDEYGTVIKLDDEDMKGIIK